ncbi:MAG: hypothetical protein A2Z34_10050 [Planctomycetes bacterium RBG_16_59_8]|nr:MAG: hypothetical protein A2Z34_10050 [Planctomycetes bacterium RBG_16_59_8]
MAQIPHHDRQVSLESLARIPDESIHAWVREEMAGSDVVDDACLYAAMAAAGDRGSLERLASVLDSDRLLRDRVSVAALLANIVW